MSELEAKISAWRAAMTAELPGQEETVRELEMHLRDHLESLRRVGMAPGEAFTASVQRLGEVHGLAREFDRLRAPWWPASWSVRGVVGVLLALTVAVLVGVVMSLNNGRMTPLLGTHVLLLTTGYLTVFATGVIGLGVLLKRWRGRLAPGERRELRAVVFRLTVMSVVLVPAGIASGMIWAADNRGSAWSWDRLEIGALGVLISSFVLLLTQLRLGFSARQRALVAVLGGTVLAFGMVCGGAITPAVPIGWLWLAFVASQGAVVLLRSEERTVAAVE